MVWLIVKFIQWVEAQNEKKREEDFQAFRSTLRTEPWQVIPDYWSKRSALTSTASEAVGDFYVAPGECINCGAPAEVAPDLIRHHDASHADGGCYFIKQPSTPQELDQAIAAVDASCVCAVRYRGNDPAVLVRISPMSVDHPFRASR